MLLKVQKTNDKIIFENKVAYLKAILIQEYINQLKISFQIRDKIKKEVIKKLQIN